MVEEGTGLLDVVNANANHPLTRPVLKHPTRASKGRKDVDIRAAKRRAVEAKAHYGRGREISTARIKDKKLRGNLKTLEHKYRDTALKARDAEILLDNQSGFLEPETELEKTYRARQDDIRRDLPTQTATKGFELKLGELGPYIADYTRNGRELLLAGRKGHTATMDWRDGKLGCEIQLGETIRDAKWLHNNSSFALAQKKYTFIYDRQGVEIHKLSNFIEVTHMEFLPYHFLLASVGNAGYLKYLDTSTGKLVVETPTKQGAPTTMCQNPHNAILHIGHQNGTVSLWSPNSSSYHGKVLTHSGPVRSIAVDREGRYVVSAGQDQKMTVWDIRMYKEVNKYFLNKPGASVAISDRNLTSVAFGTRCSIWKGLFDKSLEDQEKIQRPYMAWGGEGQHIERVRWCPLEDTLGVSHNEGFSSLVIPGAGEPNFDALEVNPYENTKQRQEAEIQGLLNKLQPETISLNPEFIGNLDLASAEKKRKEKDLDSVPEDPLLKLKDRGYGSNSALRKHLRKKSSKNIIDEKRVRIEEVMKEQKKKNKARFEKDRADYGPALARFARKAD